MTRPPVLDRTDGFGLDAIGHALATSAALAAAFAVPLYFVVFTERIFEAEKAGLLRLLGAVSLAGLIASWYCRRHVGERRPATITAGLEPTRHSAVIRHPLTLTALAAWLVTAAATLLSVAPVTSLLGSYDRGQGFLTSTALLALFAAAVPLVATNSFLTHANLVLGLPLATAIGLSTLPAALYGLVQRYGLDPLPWLGDVVTRISGPAGSSVLFAAHLALALPFVALCTARAWRAASTTGRRWDAALGAWATTFALASWALVLADSRGPALGLVGGAIVAALAWSASNSQSGPLSTLHHRTALVTLLVGGGLTIAVLSLNASRDRLDSALDWPLVGRVALALDPANSTTRVRLRLWEGSIDALHERNLLRLLIGTGPETMDLTWAPHFPPILAHDEPRGIVPDRAHNLMLDTLLTQGLLGLLALIAFFTAAIDTALGLLGLIGNRQRRIAWLSLWLGGGLAAAALATALGLPALSGPAGGLGAAAGLALWLAWSTFAPVANRREVMTQANTAAVHGFAFASLAALLVAWLELQVGFGVTSTHMLLWLIAGGLLGVALAPRDHVASAPDSTTPLHQGLTVSSAPPPADFRPASVSPAFAPLIVGATLIFTFARPGLVGGGTAIVAVLLVAGVLGVAVMVDCRRRAIVAVAVVLAAQLVTQGLVLAAGARDSSDAVTGALGSYGLYVAMLLGALLWRTTKVAQQLASPAAFTHSALPIAIVITLPALLIATPSTLLPTAADTLYKEGLLAWEGPVMNLASRGESGRAEAFLDSAIERYEHAVRLAPHEPRYRLRIGYAEDTRAVLLDERLARALAQAGRADARDEYDPELLAGYALDLATRRDTAFERALERFAEASERAGREDGSPTPHLARARALRLWGDLTREPLRRRSRLAKARAQYAWIAANVAPRWPEVLHEAAVTELLAGNPEAAALLARRAVARDPLYSAPLKTLATALAKRGDTEDAIVAWELYQRDPRNAGDSEALRGQLSALLAAGHTQDAVVVARRLTIVSPGDARAHADLAVALEGAGERAQALEAARGAAALAPGDPEIGALVDRLRGSATEHPSP